MIGSVGNEVYSKAGRIARVRHLVDGQRHAVERDRALGGDAGTERAWRLDLDIDAGRLIVDGSFQRLKPGDEREHAHRAVDGDALVLQAGEVLGNFDHKVRLDIILRVSSLNTVQPAALKELNQILEKQFSGNSNASRTTLGGIKRAADIMNFLDSSIEGQLMDSIREVDEDLSGQIEDLMFVFNNLSDVDDRGIQALLREVSSDVLVLALKGSDEGVKEKIFKNMSKRAAELLRDDLEAKGPVRVSDVETAQKEILTIARRMAEAGEIVLGGKGGEEMI